MTDILDDPEASRHHGHLKDRRQAHHGGAGQYWNSRGAGTDMVGGYSD
jgi:hypothetical protein